MKSACNRSLTTGKSVGSFSSFGARRFSAVNSSSPWPPTGTSNAKKAITPDPSHLNRTIAPPMPSKATLHTPYAMGGSEEKSAWPKRLNRPQTTPGRLRFVDDMTPNGEHLVGDEHSGAIDDDAMYPQGSSEVQPSKLLVNGTH